MPTFSAQRRSVTTFLGIATLSRAAIAQTPSPRGRWRPEGSVTLVSPGAPGSAGDQFARLLAPKLRDLWEQPVLVENRPGAEQQLGAAAVAKSRPDGRTLLLAAPSFAAANRITNPELPYRQDVDFIPVAQLMVVPGILAVSGALAVSNVAELKDYLIRNAGRVSYGYSGPAGRLYGHVFNRMLGITGVVDVNYRGSALALLGVASGEVNYIWDVYLSGKSLIDAQRLKVLAVDHDERLAELPQVPTLKEQGYPSLDIFGWWGLFAPKGTPPSVVQGIHDDVSDVLADAEVRAFAARNGLIVRPRSQQEFAGFFTRELSRFERMSQELQRAKAP